MCELRPPWQSAAIESASACWRTARWPWYADASLPDHTTRAPCAAHTSPFVLQGLLTGKYFAPGGAPPTARLNLYRGRYAEAEGRYPLEKCAQPRRWWCIRGPQLTRPRTWQAERASRG
jgi:hypothetical protein